MKIKPLSGYLLIEPQEEAKKTAGGIYLPDIATEKQQIGTVLAVGPAKITDDGKNFVFTDDRAEKKLVILFEPKSYSKCSEI